jgi:GMP synthase (glutamine-hydrolysing)
VLGVCLGAQLMAVALGGGVKRGGTRPKEIGWLGVELTADAPGDPLFGALPARFTPLHWHGDAILLPPGAKRLARSASTEVQAFRAGDGVYGVQFHLESDAAMVTGMTQAFAAELEAEGLSGEAIALQAEAHLGAQQRHGAAVFGAWADRVSGATR